MTPPSTMSDEPITLSLSKPSFRIRNEKKRVMGMERLSNANRMVVSFVIINAMKYANSPITYARTAISRYFELLIIGESIVDLYGFLRKIYSVEITTLKNCCPMLK
jgi:hypothetical protein